MTSISQLPLDAVDEVSEFWCCNQCEHHRIAPNQWMNWRIICMKKNRMKLSWTKYLHVEFIEVHDNTDDFFAIVHIQNNSYHRFHKARD